MCLMITEKEAEDVKWGEKGGIERSSTPQGAKVVEILYIIPYGSLQVTLDLPVRIYPT